MPHIENENEKGNGNENLASANGYHAHPASGIEVAVIGGGVAGLFFAIEAVRNGHHSVRIYEAKHESEQADGDYFVIGPSATRTFQHLPHLHAAFEDRGHNTWVKWNKLNGDAVFGYVKTSASFGKIIVRRDLQAMLLAELKRHPGVQIQYGDKVIEYSETKVKGQVRFESGKTVSADLIVAADGVHSRSWEIISGRKDMPISSGFSILRASMTEERALSAGPDVAAKFFSQRDKYETLEFLCGPNTHANMVFGKGVCCWLLLYKDNNTGSSSESWAKTITAQEALRLIDQTPGWNPLMKKLVAVTPAIIDWRLMMRNPQRNWVSPNGRIVQVGDSAHPFLPTSANGATQAMEDGISLATCLRLGGDAAGVPDACRVHNSLRFERVSCAQLVGLITREAFHKTDWDAVAADPSLLSKTQPAQWIGRHDVEKYSVDNYNACLAALRDDAAAPFASTNIPPGYTYKPWSVLQILAAAEEGKKLMPEGDWS